MMNRITLKSAALVAGVARLQTAAACVTTLGATAARKRSEFLRIQLRPILCVALVFFAAALAPALSFAQPATNIVADRSDDPARDAVIREILASAPSTITERLDAVEQLLNISEFDLANEFLLAALAEEADDVSLADIQNEKGTAYFVRLLKTAEVRVAGTKLTRRIFDASDRVASDPKRIAQFIKSATDDDLDTRRVAQSRLVQIGAPAMPGLIAELAKSNPANDPAIGKDHDSPELNRTKRLRKVVLDIGDSAVPALIATLYSDQSDWIFNAVQLLENIPNRDSQPHLAAINAHGQRYGETGISEPQAELIRRHIKRLMADANLFQPDEFDVIPVWIYDAKKKQLTRRTMTTTEHAFYTSQLLAKRLFWEQPRIDEHRQLFLIALISWIKVDGGIDSELPKDVEDQLIAGVKPGIRQITDADLDKALLTSCRDRQLPAAAGAAQLMGRIGDPTCVINNCYKGLEAAIRDPDPRIRFQAARSVVDIDPRGQYALAADVANALSYAASARGERQVVVLHPKPADAQRLAGILRGLRFDAITVANGREALRFARTHPDLELILVSELLKRPSWNEITQRLAQDYHSASIPVCILADAKKRPQVDGLIARFPTAGSFPTPAGRSEMVTLLRDALPRAGQFAMPREHRVSYAAAALQTLQPLIQHRQAYAFYEWDRYESQLVESISVPNLAIPASRILGELATPAAQSQLVDFASQIRQPAAARKAAAEAFAKAVERSGVLLNSRQIEQQYQRYNDNLKNGDETAAILSSVLNTIEKPSREQ